VSTQPQQMPRTDTSDGGRSPLPPGATMPPGMPMQPGAGPGPDQGSGPWRRRASLPSAVRGLTGRVSVRMRLTLLYGVLFFFAGGLLLFVTTILVADILNHIDVVGATE
jgi:hypothetical protein